MLELTGAALLSPLMASVSDAFITAVRGDDKVVEVDRVKPFMTAFINFLEIIGQKDDAVAVPVITRSIQALFTGISQVRAALCALH